jgi:uncharacterized protein YqkB
MKTLFLGLLLGVLSPVAFAQSLPDFDAIKLEKKEDFNPAADNAALQAANYLLSTPLDKNSVDRLRAVQYVLKWMSGTPDYTFDIDERAAKFTKKDSDLLGLYLAAMTKFVLEDKASAKDQNKIKLNALKSVAAYAKDKANKVKLNSELKKIIAADEQGQLAEYLTN